MNRVILWLAATYIVASAILVFCGTSFLQNLVQKYNAELRGSLQNGYIPDKSWNPNDALIRGWAPPPLPMLFKAPLPPLRGSLHHDNFYKPAQNEEIHLALPITAAPIELPIQLAPQP